MRGEDSSTHECSLFAGGKYVAIDWMRLERMVGGRGMKDAYAYSATSTLLNLRILLQCGSTSMRGLELGGVQLDLLAATLWAAWSSTHTHAPVMRFKDEHVACTSAYGEGGDARRFDSAKFRSGVLEQDPHETLVILRKLGCVRTTSQNVDMGGVDHALYDHDEDWGDSNDDDDDEEEEEEEEEDESFGGAMSAHETTRSDFLFNPRMSTSSSSSIISSVSSSTSPVTATPACPKKDIIDHDSRCHVIFDIDDDDAPPMEQRRRDTKHRRTLWPMKRWQYALGVACIVALLLAIQTSLTVVGALASQGQHAALVVARAAGVPLNADCSLVLLPTCRVLLNVMRTCIVRTSSQTCINIFVPILDSALLFHALLASLAVVWAIVHVSGHIAAYASGEQSIYTSGWINGSGFGTGIVLVALLFIVTIFSQPSFRNGSGLRHSIFKLAHVLIWPFQLTLALHAPNYWKWLVGCIALLTIDVALRLLQFRKATTLEGVRLFADAMRLHIRRPTNFVFEPGAFVRLCVPSLGNQTRNENDGTCALGAAQVKAVEYAASTFTCSNLVAEWHPFTITSAPEDIDFVDLVIRVRGDWTHALYVLCASRLNHPLPVLMNGPYGAPATLCMQCRHPILCSTGIGIAPFVSVLRTFMTRWQIEKARLQFEVAGAHISQRNCGGGIPDMVDVFWVVDSIACLQWFDTLFAELDEINEERHAMGMLPLCRLHIFVAVKQQSMSTQRSLLGSFLVRAALRQFFENRGRCLISQTATPIRLGRPNWEEELTALVDEHRCTPGGDFSFDDTNRLCAFVCGGPRLCRNLLKVARKLRLSIRRESFV